MDRDEIAKRLQEVGKRRTAALQAKNTASAEIAPLIVAAKNAGIGTNEIVRLSGVSKQGVYKFLRAND